MPIIARAVCNSLGNAWRLSRHHFVSREIIFSTRNLMYIRSKESPPVCELEVSCGIVCIALLSRASLFCEASCFQDMLNSLQRARARPTHEAKAYPWRGAIRLQTVWVPIITSRSTHLESSTQPPSKIYVCLM